MEIGLVSLYQQLSNWLSDLVKLPNWLYETGNEWLLFSFMILCGCLIGCLALYGCLINCLALYGELTSIV